MRIKLAGRHRSSQNLGRCTRTSTLWCKRHVNCKLKCCSKGQTWLERQGCSYSSILAGCIPIGCSRSKTLSPRKTVFRRRGRHELISERSANLPSNIHHTGCTRLHDIDAMWDLPRTSSPGDCSRIADGWRLACASSAKASSSRANGKGGSLNRALQMHA